jgi:hypothetical protein
MKKNRISEYEIHRGNSPQLARYYQRTDAWRDKKAAAIRPRLAIKFSVGRKIILKSTGKSSPKISAKAVEVGAAFQPLILAGGESSLLTPITAKIRKRTRASGNDTLVP